MRRLLDTSVLLASLDPDEPQHAACDRLVAGGGHVVSAHALAETFSILIGGRMGRRLAADVAMRLIEGSLLPFVHVEVLDSTALIQELAGPGDPRVEGV